METKSAAETFNQLKKLLEFSSQKGIELHVKEVRKRGSRMKIPDIKYKSSDFDTQNNDILEEIKNLKNNGLEHLVYRFQLTYDEIIETLDLKQIPTKRTGYSLNFGI